MRMRTVIGLGLGLGLGLGTAGAGPLVTPPAGWRQDTEQAASLAAKANAVTHFGGAKGLATAAVFAPPGGGVALVVTTVAAKVSTEREAAARAAVDELHATSQRAALSGPGIVEEGWQEKVDPAAKQIEATLAWRDTTAGTSTHARIVIAGDAETLVAVTGECLAGGAASAKLVETCRAALATLDPGIEPAERVALALAPTGARPTPPEPAPGPTDRPPARMDDGTRAPLPPMTVPHEPRAADRRPVYVGFGLVVLAAVFWWNRRRRAHLQEESDER